MTLTRAGLALAVLALLTPILATLMRQRRVPRD